MKYKVVVSYDGSNFSGWQVQSGKRTVQGEIEEALLKLTKQSIVVVGSGRTDAQVHAYGQVFHFESDRDLTMDGWKRAINTFLPKDIYIRSVEEIDEAFHARFYVQKKVYQYVINCNPYNPFTRNYQFQHNRPLNLELMKEAAQCFIGTHDFTAFNSTTLEEKPDQVRTIHMIELQEENGILSITFTGKGFLRYMVRMLTAILIKVGQGKITKEEVEQILLSKDKRAFSHKADACGLYLVEVVY